MELKVEGVAEVTRRLRALPPELGSKGGGPVRSALFAAMRIVRDDARMRAPRDSGNLVANIIGYRHRDPKRAGATERYDVGMRRGTKRYANNVRNRRSGRVGQKFRTAGAAYYGRFIELGTAKMPAQPFLRPAFEANKTEAVEAFRQRFLKAVEAAEKKLGRRG
jgi:HK97 gp10 family phage protein